MARANATVVLLTTALVMGSWACSDVRPIVAPNAVPGPLANKGHRIWRPAEDKQASRGKNLRSFGGYFYDGARGSLG